MSGKERPPAGAGARSELNTRKETGRDRSATSLRAQVTVTRSSLPQGASPWPLAGVPPGRFLWSGPGAGLPLNPKFPGAGRMPGTPATSPGASAYLMTTEKQRVCGCSSGHSAHPPHLGPKLNMERAGLGRAKALSLEREATRGPATRGLHATATPGPGSLPGHLQIKFNLQWPAEGHVCAHMGTDTGHPTQAPLNMSVHSHMSSLPSHGAHPMHVTTSRDTPLHTHARHFPSTQ